MPSLKELMTPENVGILIYCKLVPIPDGVLEQVEKAEKAFERLGLGGAVPERAVRPSLEKTPRARASINRDILVCLSMPPLKMWTPRQVFSAIKSTYPRQSIESVTTRLKNNSGKPDLWIGAGGKYGMPGAEAKKTSTTKPNGSTAEANANVVPAPAALPSEKPQLRVLNYVIAHGGHTKTQLIWAFAVSPTPVKAQYVGLAVRRLIKGKKITDSENGPYWHLTAVNPAASAVGIGDGAAAPA